MSFGLGSIGFGFAAGALSTFSPGVLPVLPLVLGPAVAAHRLGLPELALGLVLSFTGIGLFVAAIPLLALGSLSRQAFARWRGRLMAAGKTGKLAFGAGALGIALIILMDVDRTLEAILAAASPAWLTDLTTRY